MTSALILTVAGHAPVELAAVILGAALARA
jgi:hypothetical protein